MSKEANTTQVESPQVSNGVPCDADGCVKLIQVGDTYAYHFRLNARAHVDCVMTRTLCGEDVSTHAILCRTLEENDQ